MNKILSFSLLLILLTGCGKPPVVVTPPARETKNVETMIVERGNFEAQYRVTGKIVGSREVSVSTQGSGFVGNIYVNIGDEVVEGQKLASISDTYGLGTNTVEDARIGVNNVELAQESTFASLDQAVENSRIALEKAQRDYDAAKLDETTDTPSKAQLDLTNFITSQQKTLDGYETTYVSQLQNFQSFLANVIDTTDTLLGVSEQKQNYNDSYEYLLSALDSSKKNIADSSLRKLIPYKNWTPDASLPLISRIQELQRVYILASQVLTDTKVVLINSLADASVFSATTLAGQKSLIDGYQSQYANISTGLVTFLNGAQTFLATYERDRLSKDSSVKTNEQNAKNTLEGAKKSYDTAVKNREIATRQSEGSLSQASIRLKNAQGNLDKLAVTAPFSGVIITKSTEMGALVNPGTPLFTLSDTRNLIIKTDLTLDRKQDLHVGSEVTCIIAGTKIIGTVKSLSAGPDAQTRLYRAEISLPKVHPFVALGDIVDIFIRHKNDTVDPKKRPENDQEIIVPFTALKSLGQETYAVYVVTRDEKGLTARERIVTIKDQNDTSAVITEGLSVDEVIIVKGTLNIDDGDAISEISIPAQ